MYTIYTNFKDELLVALMVNGPLAIHHSVTDILFAHDDYAVIPLDVHIEAIEEGLIEINYRTCYRISGLGRRYIDDKYPECDPSHLLTAMRL